MHLLFFVFLSELNAMLNCVNVAWISNHFFKEKKLTSNVIDKKEKKNHLP